ncbi:MAG TPA: hypothetical protein VL523_09005 [Terriglobia bacterium]|nr:hypothetical protein [Terriglobia bacterium]
MTQSPLGLLFRIDADPSQAQAALEGFRSKTASQMESVRTEFSMVQKVQATWSTEFLAQSSVVGSALLALGEAATLTFDRFAAGLGRNISTALVYSQSMSQALDRTFKSTAASITAEAVLQGLRSMALGFYLLAVGDFAGSGSAFEAAAIWGSIGGVAAGVGAGISGTGASGLGSGPAGRYRSGSGSGTGMTGEPGISGSMLAPGALSPAAPPGSLTVAVMGDAEAANWLASTLNQGVARGIQLTATRTQRGPYAGG